MTDNNKPTYLFVQFAGGCEQSRRESRNWAWKVWRAVSESGCHQFTLRKEGPAIRAFSGEVAWLQEPRFRAK